MATASALRHLSAEAWRLATSADSVSGLVRATHLATIVRLTPLTMLTNVLSGAVVVLGCRDHESPWLLVGWSLALAAIVFLGLRSARRPVPATVSPRAIARAAAHAGLLAATWGFVPLAFLPGAPPGQQLIIAIILTGMICAGGFALALIPPAAGAFLGVLTAATVVALPSTNLPSWPLVAVLLIAFSGLILTGVMWTSQLATERILASRESTRQHEVISLLLRDFEENAADVLWETDAQLRFTHVSGRLAERLGQTVEALARTTLLETLRGLRLEPHGDDGLTELVHAITGGFDFRELPVTVSVNGQRRQWLISAKRLSDGMSGDLGWRGVITDFTAEHDAQARLAFLAHFDPLTGLVNRTRIREHIEHALEEVAIHPEGLALICLDVDHFKSINDGFGHGVGDAVLQVFADRLRAFLRPGDLAARLGGDELAILLRGVGGDGDALRLATALHEAVAAPAEVDGKLLNLSASAGVVYLPLHGTTVDEAFAHADLALYAAKEGGRNRVELFVDRLGDKNRRSQEVAAALRAALTSGALEIYWQPKVDLAQRRATAAEALVRWRDPVLGSVSPAEFIPVAEDAGLIDLVDDWVLRNACAQAARCLPGLGIAVNVSPAQFVRPDYVERVAEALGSSGLDPSLLELEVTESLFLGELPLVSRNMDRLRGLGVRIALDDFGTGYSSLAYLRRFPFDTLKIDRSFVREILSTHDARAIVAMIIQLGTTLGMTTVAEGVEEPGQLELLESAGCNVIQGYVFAKPMTLDHLCQYLRQPIPAWVSPRPRTSRISLRSLSA